MNIKESHEIWICACCIGEAFLRERIEVNGSSNACHYCEETHACFTLETISNLTEQAIGEHFIRTSDEPSAIEYAMIKHCGHDWYRDGEEVGQVIEDLLQTSPEVAHDIQQLLEERHSDFDSEAIGVETEFASESHYVERRKVNTGRLNSMWERFVTTLQTESRYINPSVRETLDDLFSGVETMRSGRNGTVIIEAGPDTEVTFLYRARWCRGHDELENMLVTPDRELGPPPFRLSGANRMSARGISVFYGASSAETAISEIRPPVGCNVVCAKFFLIRPLRLLNLLALENVWESGSMLDPDFIRKREQATFLRTLTSRIVEPVLPGEEDFSYIPTQVIAEYLAGSSTLALDGILYPSVQLSGFKSDESYNVVLFHKASCVRYLMLPARQGSRINYGHQYDEDDWETDICVTEIAELVDANSQPEEDEIIPNLKDNREPAIEIDLLSVSVHGIRAARFEYSTDTVRRDRHVYKPAAARPAVSEAPPWNLDSDHDDIPY
ncbi:RES family NAD+ phosphorylase [Yersinia enterocolitica]|uniref:RES family NAD+ phosphorylase n=1 Tax=Rahnella perminowiae TaxID=2816244 RepID=UPI003656B64C